MRRAEAREESDSRKFRPFPIQAFDPSQNNGPFACPWAEVPSSGDGLRSSVD